MRTIALLTDFGQTDHYVGVMKGVIASIAPDSPTVDISHNVPAQSILAGQWLLRASSRYFPDDTIFLAVIDPGVGTERRPMALQAEGQIFVGPDNGLFTPWLEGDWQAVELTAERYRLPRVSGTFHGRDVFAPAAAHLASGNPLAAFGPPINDPVRLAPARAIKRSDGTVEGSIVYIDRFGNLISNIDAPGNRAGHVLIAGLELPLRLTYGQAAPDQPVAVTGSEGTIEVAVRDGNAAQRLELGIGQPVLWRPGS